MAEAVVGLEQPVQPSYLTMSACDAWADYGDDFLV